jgi:hypothetical protein
MVVKDVIQGSRLLTIIELSGLLGEDSNLAKSSEEDVPNVDLKDLVDNLYNHNHKDLTSGSSIIVKRRKTRSKVPQS